MKNDIDTLIEFLKGVKEKGYKDLNITVIFENPRLETEYRVENIKDGVVYMDVYDNHNFSGLHLNGSVDDILFEITEL